MAIDDLARLINIRKKLTEVQAVLFEEKYLFGLYYYGNFGYAVEHHDIDDKLNKQFIETAKEYYAKRIEQINKDIESLCKEQ